MSEAAAAPVYEPPPDLAIRTRPPSPKRLNRKVLLGGALALGAVVVFAVLSGLSDRPDRAGDAARVQGANAGPPETIAGARSSYEAAELGGAALDLEPPTDPIWTETGGGERARPDTSQAAPPPGGERPPDPQAQARAAPILFGEGRATEPADGSDDSVLDARLAAPRSRYALQAGHTIPAALVTALNSDAPGRVIAQVAAPVYDSVTGAHLIIPAGARLIGTYQSGARYGDRRIMLAWDRLIFPNGWSINLRQMEASDGAGAAGLGAHVDNRLGRLAGAVLLSSVVSVVANEAEDDEERGSLAQSVGDATAQQAAQTGSQIVERELTVRPTLRVRAGAPVRVLVTRDIVLRPYTGAGR